MSTLSVAVPEPVRPIDPRTAPAAAVHRFCTLPNGLEIACQSAKETEHIYEDIFDHRVYLSNGVTLWDGATVFDVGGNIGLFTVFVHHTYRDVATYTFEPAPPLFEILRFNAARHGGDCKLFHCGVGARRRTAELTFYPFSSGMSSFYGNAEEEREVLRIVLENQRRAGHGEIDAVLADADQFLDARFTESRFTCPIVPLSEVIRDQGVEAIDLLKIDVQKSELDVLYGLEPRDWPKVRQIAMEVHDLDGQLEVARELLAERGFNVVVEQDALYRGSVMFNLFAVRKDLYQRLVGRAPVLSAGAASAATEARGAARSSRSKEAFARLRGQRRER